MEQWLVEQAPKLIIGLVSTIGLGTIALFIRLSLKQALKLYKDDLVQCESREDGYQEVIAQRDETIRIQQQTITFYAEQSTYREARLAELLKEIGERRDAEQLLERTTQQRTRRRSP